MPTRAVNMRRESYDVYIGRAGKGQDGYFGNPFKLGDGTREEVLKKFRAYFLGRIDQDREFRRRVLDLHGKRLGCFCKPAACHGDVIAEWVDAQVVHESETEVMLDRGDGYVRIERKEPAPR